MHYIEFAIKNLKNNISCKSFGQDKKTGKWAGAIILYRKKLKSLILYSSNKIFDSSEEAVAVMKLVVRNIRKK